jgi:uncharacterized small protein (DUF1192 family)
MRDDDTVRQPPTHRIGEKLDDCSVAELDERILLLRAEIDRLESTKAQKQSALIAAGSVFKS